MKQILPGIIAILMILTSCSSEVEVTIPEQSTALVIHSYFTVDSLWQVEVSRTNSTASKPEKNLVENAIVILWQNIIPLDTLIEKASGNYQSEIKPNTSTIYTLSAEAAGFPLVTATSLTPDEAVGVEIVSLKPAEDLPAFLDNYEELLLAIDAKPGEKKYFNLTLWVIQENESRVRVDSAFLTDETVVGSRDDGRGITFSASQLSEEGQLEVFLPAEYLKGKQLVVFLKTISPEYYQYETSLLQHLNTTGTPFSQPVPVFSNVDNGYGIFAGYLVATDSLGI